MNYIEDPVLLAEARQLHATTLVIDLHQDTLLPAGLFGYDPARRHGPLPPPLGHLARPLFGQSDLPRLREGGVSGVGFGVVTNPFWAGRALRGVYEDLDRLRGLAAAHPDQLLLATGPADFSAALATGRVAAFPVLEGTHCLGPDLGELGRLQEAGLAGVGLVHFTASRAAPASSSRSGRRGDPLSPWGHALIAECCQRGLLLDLAHLASPALHQALQAATRPLVISHTGVAGVYPYWRNVDDEALRLVAQRGGCVGIILYGPYLGRGLVGSLELAVAHAEHVVQVAGEDTVALGSDIDGFLPWLLPGLRGSDDLPRVTAAFLARGWPEDRLRKLLGGNACRVLGEAWSRPDR